MKPFGKVESRFWESPDICSLSEQAKLLALYLLTCKHGNMLGVFRLPRGYIAGDLGWDSETVSRTLHELITNGFISVRKDSDYVCINRFIKHNDTTNKEQLQARIQDLKRLPEQVPDITHILDAVASKALVYKDSEKLLAELSLVREKFVESSSEVRLERKREREKESKRVNTYVRSADRPRPKRNNPPYSDDFEHWWSQYPKRGGRMGCKRTAWGYYKKYLREGCKPDDLLSALMRYKRFCDTPDERGKIATGTRYVLQPTTFLNDPDCITNQWMVNHETDTGLTAYERSIEANRDVLEEAGYLEPCNQGGHSGCVYENERDIPEPVGEGLDTD
ncbi:hypothetical protein [Endozoicomonas sp. Mp262]|uniref:hypothetical protein n=1 Tax=Endozoicomonas sp. Mp262 TaxID=2919499 RepID=UPI0021D881DF